MKSMIVVALALVAIAVALPVEEAQREIKTLRSNFDQQPEGGYNFGFETENKITRQETGEVKEVLDEDNKPHNVIVVRGSYSYVDADGTPVEINYIADQDGYRAEGSTVPKAQRR